MISLFIHIFIISVIFIGCNRKIKRMDDRIIFGTFLLLKISCGILVGLLYWSYYGGDGDTIYFFEQAKALFQYFQASSITFWEWTGFAPLSLTHAEFSAQAEPRTFFFVRFISFLYAFCQGNYFTISVYLSFFAGLATWGFASELVKMSKINKFAIYFALLFIPSITFWSSGLLKESLMTISLYAFGFFILKWRGISKTWFYIIPLVICVIVLWKLKYYVPITLLPIVLLTLVISRSTILSSFTFPKKLVLYLVMLIVGGVAVAFLHPVFYSGRFFELIQISHDVIAEKSSTALIHFEPSEINLLFTLQNLPLAWFTGIFRPFIWESFDAFSLLWAVEKAIFTILTIIAFVFSFRLKLSEVEKWWALAILIYASVLSAVISLTTPNFGTLIRYEVAYMPFVWLLVLTILNKYKQNLK